MALAADHAVHAERPEETAPTQDADEGDVRGQRRRASSLRPEGMIGAPKKLVGTLCERIQHAIRWSSSALWPVLLLLQLWAVAYCFLGPDVQLDGPLFRLAAMFVLARLAGGVLTRVVNVPALVAMLLVGLAAKNLGLLQLPPEYVALVADLRKIALALIMVRAGLGLDPGALRSLSLLVLGLALLPAAVEVAAIVGLGYLLLGLPPLWGLLLGLVLCAVAPSVVMPCFMELRVLRLGVDKGIDTLVVAAASFDDVIAISLFGLVQSLIFNGGTTVLEMLQHPLGLLFGILYGLVLGLTLRAVPSKESERLSLLRFALLSGGGLAVTFGSDALGYHEAASVGCISAAFFASAGWRASEGVHAVDGVEKNFEMLWAIFEPIMFSLIGADIDVTILNGGVVGLAFACIILALVFRTFSTWLLLLCGDRFNWKERLFVALAWLPKADVQAALGPLALDAARRVATPDGPDGDAEAEARASTVLLLAVLSILLTAPAGSVLISVLSRRLLSPAPLDHDLEDGDGRTNRAYQPEGEAVKVDPPATP